MDSNGNEINTIVASSSAFEINLEAGPSVSAAITGTPSRNFNADIIRFNASNVNSIYGSSETIQPPALALIPQIKF